MAAAVAERWIEMSDYSCAFPSGSVLSSKQLKRHFRWQDRLKVAPAVNGIASISFQLIRPSNTVPGQIEVNFQIALNALLLSIGKKLTCFTYPDRSGYAQDCYSFSTKGEFEITVERGTLCCHSERLREVLSQQEKLVLEPGQRIYLEDISCRNVAKKYSPSGAANALPVEIWVDDSKQAELRSAKPIEFCSNQPYAGFFSSAELVMTLGKDSEQEQKDPT
jgi:hypothetical protein